MGERRGSVGRDGERMEVGKVILHVGELPFPEGHVDERGGGLDGLLPWHAVSLFNVIRCDEFVDAIWYCRCLFVFW